MHCIMHLNAKSSSGRIVCTSVSVAIDQSLGPGVGRKGRGPYEIPYVSFLDNQSPSTGICRIYESGIAWIRKNISKTSGNKRKMLISIDLYFL